MKFMPGQAGERMACVIMFVAESSFECWSPSALDSLFLADQQHRSELHVRRTPCTPAVPSCRMHVNLMRLLWPVEAYCGLWCDCSAPMTGCRRRRCSHIAPASPERMRMRMRKWA